MVDPGLVSAGTSTCRMLFDRSNTGLVQPKKNCCSLFFIVFIELYFLSLSFHFCWGLPFRNRDEAPPPPPPLNMHTCIHSQTYILGHRREFIVCNIWALRKFAFLLSKRFQEIRNWKVGLFIQTAVTQVQFSANCSFLLCYLIHHHTGIFCCDLAFFFNSIAQRRIWKDLSDLWES